MTTVTPPQRRPVGEPARDHLTDRATLLAVTAAWYDPDGAAWEPEPSRSIEPRRPARPPIHIALTAEDVRR